MRAIRNPLARASAWLFTISCLPLGLATAGDFNSPALRLTQSARGPLAQAEAPQPVPAAPATPDTPIPPDPAVPPMITQEAPVNPELCVPQGECTDECSWCNLGDAWTLKGAIAENRCLEPDDMPFTIAGWAQFGYTNRTDGVFNTHPDSFDLHQGYLYVEKIADGSECVGFGFRADVMYGVDAQNTQAFGNNPGRWDFQNGWDHGIYGWAMPQLYGEIAWDKTSVKVGHFYTLMGYEVVTAPGNFFYSHAFTMNFGEAFTHTGVVATHTFSDKFKGYGGWTLGWDTGFDRLNDGSNFLGGFTWSATDTLTATYITTYGNLGWIGDGYAHSVVVDKKFGDKWNYVFQTDLVSTELGVFGGDTFHAVGVNQYLFYTFNDCLKAGARVEWWKADGVSYNEVTGGVNYRPHANVVIRPEVRYQWSPAVANPIGIPEQQTIFGIDMVLTF